MSEDKKEQISAMMDGELESPSVAAIFKSGKMQSSWARYHLISDCLQHQLPESVDTGLAGRISQSIEQEPHLLAPARASKPTYIKPVAGFVIAASVATMAILGIQQNTDTSAPRNETSVAFSSSVNSNNLPHQAVATNGVTEAQLRQVKDEARARMNSYLVNYSEYRTNAGLQGMLPYARTVTYENNR